ARMKKTREAGRPLYTVGAGTGISAKFVEAGGADLVSTYPIAKYRMAGLSSMAGYLPLCDSNATTLEMGEREILPIIKEIPVAAGLLGADPTRDMNRLLDRVWEVGFSGILNCPTLALVDGNYRLALEETGLSFAREVEMIRLARLKDLFTHAFCSTVKETELMVEAGCDMVVAHMGNSVGGTIGSKTVVSIDEAVEKIQTICDTAKKRNPEVLVICHGGPIAFPEDFQQVFRRTSNLDGFMGGSSGERFPVEKGVAEVTGKYKAISR
ncbi:MAG: phosphoenolpyruvate hydrolase family protein, partial [Candidatus Methylomirabilales bacterium]